jgi:hypothetical protein
MWCFHSEEGSLSHKDEESTSSGADFSLLG